MSNGKWQMEKQRGFAILHLRFAIEDALFSILRGRRLDLQTAIDADPIRHSRMPEEGR